MNTRIIYLSLFDQTRPAHLTCHTRTNQILKYLLLCTPPYRVLGSGDLALCSPRSNATNVTCQSVSRATSSALSCEAGRQNRVQVGLQIEVKMHNSDVQDCAPKPRRAIAAAPYRQKRNVSPGNSPGKFSLLGGHRGPNEAV